MNYSFDIQSSQSNLLPFIIKSFFILFLFCAISCGSSDMDTEDTSIATITISPDNQPVISLGQDVQLDAEAKNSAGDEVSIGSVTWVSSDPGVISVTNNGLMSGISAGTATLSAEAGGESGSVEFLVADLTGKWVGGELPDTVSYTLTQTGNMIDGVFNSRLGFPPITDVKTGVLTGSLNFSRYEHELRLTTEDGCQLRIKGPHHIDIQGDGSIILSPGTGSLSSSNCSINGTIDFTTLRRE